MLRGYGHRRLAVRGHTIGDGTWTITLDGSEVCADGNVTIALRSAQKVRSIGRARACGVAKSGDVGGCDGELGRRPSGIQWLATAARVPPVGRLLRIAKLAKDSDGSDGDTGASGVTHEKVNGDRLVHVAVSADQGDGCVARAVAPGDAHELLHARGERRLADVGGGLRGSASHATSAGTGGALNRLCAGLAGTHHRRFAAGGSRGVSRRMRRSSIRHGSVEAGRWQRIVPVVFFAGATGVGELVAEHVLPTGRCDAGPDG
mmetsp:Transcript_20494/g.63757  ORF Transcript_20494/g.63757 Transcript_20494/m.63757 type:complete len:261 (+) Transcript_20494:379-1161(+)